MEIVFLEFFHILAQFTFITSESELVYYHQKVNIWVASPVAKQLLRLKVLGT